jgi:hypothetical protein
MKRKIFIVTRAVTCLGLPFAVVGNGTNDSINAIVKLKFGGKLW